jgi:thiol-disulfide isomerase/thioredoxin
MDRFYAALAENGVNPNERDWVKELFFRHPVADAAIEAARAEIRKQEAFIDGFAPAFKTDFERFATAFKLYISIGELSLQQLEAELEALSKKEMDVTVLTIPFFREYLVDLTNAYAGRKLEGYGIEVDYLKEGYITQHIAAEACAKFIPNQSVINYLLYDKINRELIVNTLNHPRYVDFLFAHVDQSVADQFAEKMAQLKANSTGKEKKDRPAAFDFTLHDKEGKMYRLADFKGKMLFIDFWASWCAPCKAQIPHIKELEKQYAGKDIVFASVSLDVNKSAWLKAVNDENLHGAVLYAEGAFKNPFPVHYGIQAIPRFMLIDANGKVISDNMPKPQDRKAVTAMIDADLYNQELDKVLAKHFEALGASSLKGGNTLHIKMVQTIPGITSHAENWYSYPKNLRSEAQIEENPQMVIMLGPDLFKKRTMIMRADTVFGTEKNMLTSAEGWMDRLHGLNLFLRREAEQLPLEFAPENSSNTDNQYVIQTTRNGKTEKFYIDKTSFLLTKVVTIGPSDIRQGGGRLEATTKYEDYRNIGGVILPYYINSNNIITLKVKEAELKPGAGDFTQSLD